MLMVMVAIGLGAWAMGRAQSEGGFGFSKPGGGFGSGSSSNAGSPPRQGRQSGPHSHSNGYASGPPPNGHSNGYAGGGTQTSWHQRGPSDTEMPNDGSGASPRPEDTAKGGWERAREETRKREEERKAKEAEKKRKEELEKKLREAREKEARERAARDKESKEKESKEKEAREREARLREARLKEAREREAREALLREARAKEAREKEAREKEVRDKEAKEKEARAREALEKEIRERLEREKKLREEQAGKARSTAYAYSAMGEKINPWPNGRPTDTRSEAPSPTKNGTPQSPSTPKKASPSKNPPPPTAEEDTYSYRPYDKPKRPARQKSQSSLYSDYSWAASQTTSKTTPPPSQRGPYSTKDPDKIVIKGVYAFNNAFTKTPTSQLLSGIPPVTDGLILRITTEGLFIDDDVRGVPQREWDVKAWTMKLVEVWCPHFSSKDPAGKSSSASARASLPKNPVRRIWNLDKERAISTEETNTLLNDLMTCCKDHCRFAFSASDHDSVYSASSFGSSPRSSITSASSVSSSSSPASHHRYHRSRDQANRNGASSQTGELKSAGLHVLRASIRDQEGKKYVFVISHEESWKMAVGLQKLRKGSQVRALGVSGMSTGDARGLLDNLGYL